MQVDPSHPRLWTKDEKEIFLLQLLSETLCLPTLDVRSRLPALCPSQDPADLRQNLSICLPSGAPGALRCSAQQEQVEVSPDAVKMFVPHMVAAHALLVSVPKWQVSLLLLMSVGSCLPNHTACNTAKLRAVCFQEIPCSTPFIYLGKNRIPHTPLEGFIPNMLLDGSHNVAKHKLQKPF